MRIFIAMILMISSLSTFASTSELPIELKWGINVEPIEYFKKAAERFKDTVESRTKGKIKVKLVINEFEPGGREHIRDVQHGRYDMGQSVTFELAAYVPQFNLWDLPFLFDTDEQVTRYLESAHSKANLAKLEKFGILPFAHTYSGGFLAIYGDKFDSFKQLQGHPMAQEAAGDFYRKFLKKEMSMEVLPLDHDEFADNYPKVKSAEIIESTLDQLYSAAKEQSITVNQTDHRVISRVLYISKKFFNSLSKDLQQIVFEEGVRAAAYERQLAIDDKIAKFKTLADHGIKLNRWSNEQRAEDKKLFEKLYLNFAKKIDSKGVSVVEALPKTMAR
jgi:TRAP-type C4-dicarboxylate transport system substrate-binding protein